MCLMDLFSNKWERVRERVQSDCVLMIAIVNMYTYIIYRMCVCMLVWTIWILLAFIKLIATSIYERRIYVNIVINHS